MANKKHKDVRQGGIYSELHRQHREADRKQIEKSADLVGSEKTVDLHKIYVNNSVVYSVTLKKMILHFF